MNGQTVRWECLDLSGAYERFRVILADHEIAGVELTRPARPAQAQAEPEDHVAWRGVEVNVSSAQLRAVLTDIWHAERSRRLIAQAEVIDTEDASASPHEPLLVDEIKPIVPHVRPFAQPVIGKDGVRLMPEKSPGLGSLRPAREKLSPKEKTPSPRVANEGASPKIGAPTGTESTADETEEPLRVRFVFQTTDAAPASPTQSPSSDD